MAIENEKPKISFVGCGFVGGTWIKYLEKERKYVRGRDFFCYDPPKDMVDDINKANIVVVSVPTPASESGICDLSIVRDAVSRIDSGKWVIIRSTVSPGTTAKLQKEYPDKNFIFMPEFLTEARAEEDFRNPDRLILAPANKNFKIVDTLLSLLPKARALTVPSYPDTYTWLDVTPTEAELAKYFGNIMGSTKVTLAEIFATACQLLESRLKREGLAERVDYGHVRKVVAADYRIGDSHLKSKHGGYRGFGGYCFIKDTYAFLSFLSDLQWFFIKNKASEKLIRLIDANISFFQNILHSNALLLEIQGLTEKEAMTHTEELEKIIGSKELKDVGDYT